jgi:hypothetical protein
VRLPSASLLSSRLSKSLASGRRHRQQIPGQFWAILSLFSFLARNCGVLDSRSFNNPKSQLSGLATIHTIANTGAMLVSGQERSKEKTALTSEPCRGPDCSCATPWSASSLTEFEAHTTTPHGWPLLVSDFYFPVRICEADAD